MDYSDMVPRGMISQTNNILRVDNALIEEIYINHQRTGYILISYGAEDQNNLIQKDLLSLIVGKDTIIINQFKESILLYDLRKGMRINAEFSSAMTRSLPPQTRAFRIMVRTKEPSVNVTTDRVVSIAADHGFLNTGNPYDLYDQMRFSISDTTVILDQIGNRIPLEAIQPGQLVRVEHAIFQTMSLPPQSPAYRVQLLS